MEILYIVMIGILSLAVLALVIYIFSLRSAIGEIALELDDKLKTDTNTLISVSSGDRSVKKLASKINRQLQSLRKERLKLRHGDAELKSAVTNISHDLRTPLTAVCGYLDLMEQEPLTEESSRYLAIIRERTNSMRTLTQELFNYSVISASEDEAEKKEVSLNDVLEQSLVGFYGVFSQRGIEPEIEMPEEAVIRLSDESSLRRIFDNILSNAAKYSDGDLKVKLTKDGEVSFENSAKDLDRVKTERLFDRFFTVQTASGSTGLGLSIAKLLTEKLGGSIGAEYRSGKLKVIVKPNREI